MRRAVLESGATAAGMSLAASLHFLWFRPAPASQLPGMARALGVDAHGPLILAIVLIGGAVMGALAGRALSRAFEGAVEWAVWLAVGAMVAVVWLAVAGESFPVLLGCVAVIAFAVRARHAPSGLTAQDAALVPAVLIVDLALLELFSGLSPGGAFVLAVLFVLALRVAVRGAPWAVTAVLPLIVLELGFQNGDRAGLAAGVLVLAIALPLAAAYALRDRPPITALRRAAPLVFAFVALAYTHILISYKTPPIDLFEHGFDLAPASELMRGGHLYTDALPPHGPVSDGLLDATAMSIFGTTAGAVLRVRYVAALLTPLALYGLVFVLTRSPLAAFAGVMLDLALFPATTLSLCDRAPAVSVRLGPSLVALALTIAASRRRSARLFLVAAVVAGFAALTSIDYGLYAIIALAFAGMRSGRRAFLASAAGVLGVAAIWAVYLLATGSLGSFLTIVFVDMRQFLETYSVGFFRPERCCGGDFRFPQLLAYALVRTGGFLFVGWIAATIAFAVLLFRRRRRTDSFFIIATWIVAGTLSYVERRNEPHTLLLAPVVVALATLLIRSRRWRVAGITMAVLLVVAADPGRLFLRSAPDAVRARAIEVSRIYVEYDALPRAHGVLFVREDVPKLELLRLVVARTLRPEETFYVYTNLSSLYFLFDRPMPVVVEEAPMIESAESQGETIARLQSQKNVRAVIEHFPYWSDSLDDIPNRERIPAVTAFIEETFPGVFSRGGLVYRVRR